MVTSSQSMEYGSKPVVLINNKKKYKFGEIIEMVPMEDIALSVPA